MFSDDRPQYQPTGASPTTSSCRRRASAIAARSSSSGMSLWSTHLRPWDAISHPAARIARTCAGPRARADATP